MEYFLDCSVSSIPEPKSEPDSQSEPEPEPESESEYRPFHKFSRFD
jgi:hypothetical protein